MQETPETIYGNRYIPIIEEAEMKDWMESIEARTQAQKRYDKKNTIGFYMKLNIHTDQDIIRWMWSQPSKQGSIKKLIREEIARGVEERDCKHIQKGPTASET